MDEHRTKTLQALEAFVETQKVLLARQWADTETLQRLKIDLVQRPSQVISHFPEGLTGNAFRLSEQDDCRLRLPKEIDWSSFQNSDARPLQEFAQRSKAGLTERNQFPTQRSSLSDLQKLVKHARRTIVDPILLRFQDMSPEPESSEEEIDPVERRRELERQKISELKKRQIRGGLSLPLSSVSGSMGVFIRNDVDDEAMNADVSIDDDETPVVSVPQSQPCPYATKAPAPISPPPKRLSPAKFAKPKKERGHEESYASGKVSKAPIPSSPPDPDEEDDDNTNMPPPKLTKGGRVKQANPKPETYKQAWSTSEQNLLEQLLEEIPEGERFRWQKISKAMGGRRTPRQVASRVQKYFEKLKKFSLL